MTLKLALANVRRSYKDFAIYFFTLVVGVAVFYAFNSIQAQQAVLNLDEMQSQMLELMDMLIGIVSVLVVIILAFLVVYANRLLIRRRNKEFGLYLLMGMTRGMLFRLTCAETLLVGVVSLVAGLALGILLSQALVWVTALIFVADLSEGFSILFAPEAAVLTVVLFCAIFAFSLIINVGYLAKCKLVDLLNAERKNDNLTLRSIPVAFVLFLIACALIGVAYWQLLEYGMIEMDWHFWLATALMVVGTLLFFYSLSGFLLLVAQRIKPLYYRGLNMVVLRQVASRINSSFASMGVICVTLFFAITSVCSGIGVASAMQANIEKTANYDATVRTTYSQYDERAAGTGSAYSFYEEMDGDMNEGLAQAATAVGGTQWSSMVAESAQLDFYNSEVTYGDMDALAGKKLSDYTSAVSEGYEIAQLSVVKLSQVNHVLEISGREPIQLEEGQALLSADHESVQDYLADVAASGGTLTVFGTQLSIVNWADSRCYETTSVPMQTGLIVVNDDVIPTDAQPTSSLLDINFVDDGALDAWTATMDKIADDPNVWGFNMYQTRQEVYNVSMGLTTVCSYLAVYIGFVLVVACAAILAIQQLTSATDNRTRYQLLEKLGATQGMVNGALLKQILIAFAFPMALAVCHTVCALMEVTDTIEVFGQMNIAETAAITGASFLVVYGIYFTLTYFQARRVIR